MFIVLYEGLLGGGVYVNAFYAISREVSLVIMSIYDWLGLVNITWPIPSVSHFNPESSINACK